MNGNEWIERLEKLAPISLACEWDNPGLMAGRTEKEISRVLVALDATEEILDLAVKERADLLLTHHPLIFRPIKRVTSQDFIGKRLLTLIQNNICCYSMHTNFDVAPGCMADLAAARLHLTDQRALAPMGEWNGVSYGIGKTGRLPEAMSLEGLADKVKEAFGLPAVGVYGLRQAASQVCQVAVCPGSGGDMAGEALAAGAQVLITGDVSHHRGIDAAAQGLAVIDAGHYGLEHIFVDFMASYCKERIDAKADIRRAPLEFPAALR